MHTVLSARTDFSVGESTLKVASLIEEAEKFGAKVVAITDTMSVTGMIDFSNKAKKAGIKPIIGTRLRLTENPEWRPQKGEKKKHMPRAYFLTAYVRREEGMKALFRLLTLGYSNDRFYYEPKLGFQDLYDELDRIEDKTSLVFSLGEDRSVLEFPDHADVVGEIITRGFDVFAPLIPINSPYYGRVNKLSCRLIEDASWLARYGMEIKPLLVRPSLHQEDQADARDIMGAIMNKTKISEPWFRSKFNRDLSVMSVPQMIPCIKDVAKHLSQRGIENAGAMFAQGLKNTQKFADSIEYVWEKQDVSLPKMAENEFEAVKSACVQGWAKRFTAPVFGHTPTANDLKEKYMPRLKYELSVLERLNFSGYFLLVQEIVKFSKDNDILVGPGRGSVGGSLVAYLMGITECDPIRFELLFERFINPDRIDLPDADLDFMSVRRHEVIEYLIEKFGKNRVAGVSNFGTLGAASSIRDVGRVAGIPDTEFSVSKMVPKKHGASASLSEAREEVSEIEEFATKHEVLWPIMEAVEGNIRNFSQHAAGIVVAGEDLVKRAVLESRKDNTVVCWDKRIVEDQGLVKVDILGLSTLDLIGLSLDYIKERTGAKIDLNAIPLDDLKVLKQFAEGNTTGIFQFESGGMRRLLKEIAHGGDITFDEITAATALYRPGPMESGMMDSFFKRKQGEEAIDYDHPLMEPILSETYGVIVYQEQVMKVSQVIAGYSGAEADKLRKIMGKKLPEEMAKERGKFVEGCVKTIECEEDWAGRLFDKIEGFAGYGFNKSHSVEYTLISYQSMYLKVNHPVEFYAAALTLLDEEKLPGVIRDARAAGILVDMPDINHSGKRFEIATDTRLTIPFQRIKGLSEKTADAILTARTAGPFLDKTDFLGRVAKRQCNKRHQDLLDKVGAFANIEPGQLPSNDPSRIKDQIELIPGLISAHVPIDREMHRDKDTRAAIDELVREYRDSAETDGMPVKPSFGRGAKIMIVTDAPGAEEDNTGSLGFSRSNTAVLDALDENGLQMSDVYWTSLVKRPKKGRFLTGEEIQRYKGYLDREINILKPPVIVMLGSTTTRYFLSDFKGKASDVAGKVVYNPHLDLNLVVGFSAGEIYHDPSKQTNMNAVFASVAELLS